MAFFGRAYMKWAQRAPFSSQVVVATSKTVLADVIVQTTVEGKSFQDMDYKRVGIFGAFGCLYLGVVQYGLYVKLMQRVFDPTALAKFCNAPFRQKIKDKAGLKILAGTIALDFVVIQPFLYWPSYYAVKAIGFGSDGNPDGVTSEEEKDNTTPSTFSLINGGLLKYKNNFVEDNLGMCGFWLPMDVIIYSVPLHLRLHLNHIISFAWVALMSIFRGEEEEEDVKIEDGDDDVERKKD